MLKKHILPPQSREVKEMPVGLELIIGVGADVDRLAGIENQQRIVVHPVQNRLSSCFKVHR